MFVESIKARSYVATMESGTFFKESIGARDQRIKLAEEKATLAFMLDFIAEEMDRVARDDGLMVRLSVVNPLNSKPPEEPQE